MSCLLMYVYNGHYYQTGDVRKETLSDYTGWVQLLIRNPCNVFTHLPLNYGTVSTKAQGPGRRGWSLERMLVYMWINMLTRWIISVLQCILFSVHEWKLQCQCQLVFNSTKEKCSQMSIRTMMTVVTLPEWIRWGKHTIGISCVMLMRPLSTCV